MIELKQEFKNKGETLQEISSEKMANDELQRQTEEECTTKPKHQVGQKDKV